jgi:hypothetical protein
MRRTIFIAITAIFVGHIKQYSERGQAASLLVSRIRPFSSILAA